MVYLSRSGLAYKKNGMAGYITSTVFTFPFEDISFWNISGSVALSRGSVLDEGGTAKAYAPII